MKVGANFAEYVFVHFFGAFLIYKNEYWEVDLSDRLSHIFLLEMKDFFLQGHILYFSLQQSMVMRVLVVRCP